MNCQKCHAVLTHRNKQGDAMIRTKGFVLKATGPVLICPRCAADVPFNLETLKVLPALVLFHRKPGR